jgi:hypothetical protein
MNNGGGNNNRNRSRKYNNNNRYGRGGDNSPRARKQVQATREKYLNMAKEALSSGERVDAEFYFQHADHYTRVLNEMPVPENQQNQQANEEASEKSSPAEAEGNVVSFAPGKEPQKELTQEELVAQATQQAAAMDEGLA